MNREAWIQETLDACHSMSRDELKLYLKWRLFAAWDNGRWEMLCEQIKKQIEEDNK